MLTVNNLSFDYENIPLLRSVNWSLQAGKLLHLCAGNGRGKSTLLRLLAGLLQPRQGDIVWMQQSIYQDLAAFQQQICYLGHKPGLSLNLTVLENCLFSLQSQSKSLNCLKLQEYLSKFELEKLADKRCYQLSEGQLRRVALLRLALSESRLWLLDEPYTALDAHSVTLLTRFFNEHLEAQGLIVMTSHHMLPEGLLAYETYQL